MKLKNIPILLMPLLLLTSLSACDNTSSNETVENIKIKSIKAIPGEIVFPINNIHARIINNFQNNLLGFSLESKLEIG